MKNNKELQQKFLQYLAKKSGAKTEKELEDYIKGLGEEGLKKAQEEFMASLQQKAAHGAKLNYFRKLKNICADDEQLIYFKKGGRVDCGCVKKAQGGTDTGKFVTDDKVKKEDLYPTKAIEDWKKDWRQKQSIKKQEEQNKRMPMKPFKKRTAEEQKKIDQLSEKDYMKGKQYKQKYFKGGSLNRIPFIRAAKV